MPEEFYLKIYLFRPNRVPPIKISRNSKLKITIETMDYTIPEGATASAFAKGAFSDKVYTQSCTVDGNRISFIQEPGFFVQGRNILQYEIGDSVIPLAIDVNCGVSLPDGGEAVEPDAVKPYVLRAEEAAKKSEAAAGMAQEVNDSIPADYTALSNTVGKLKSDKADKTALARTDRILDALWKLNQGISYQFEMDDTEGYQKTVPTGAVGANVNAVGGKTIVWNQSLGTTSFGQVTENGVTVTNNNDGSFTINGTATEIATFELYNGFIPWNLHHKMFGVGGISDGIFIQFVSHNGDKTVGNNDFGNGVFFVSNASVSVTYVYIVINGGTVCDNVRITPLVFDVTAMFGSGNEPTTTDNPRIAWIEQYATKHPEYNAGGLVSAEVESVVTNQSVYAIPEAVRNLPGYGWAAGDVCNSIERTEAGWQYVQRVASVDLGSLSWSYNSTGKFFYSYPNGIGVKGWHEVLCEKYITSNYLTDLSADNIAFQASDWFGIRDLSYGESITSFKTDMIGVMLHYELAEPIMTDITDLMAYTLDAITVEAGGTLTFENAAKLPVPSSMEYAVKLSGVI